MTSPQTTEFVEYDGTKGRTSALTRAQYEAAAKFVKEADGYCDVRFTIDTIPPLIMCQSEDEMDIFLSDGTHVTWGLVKKEHLY